MRSHHIIVIVISRICIVNHYVYYNIISYCYCIYYFSMITSFCLSVAFNFNLFCNNFDINVITYYIVLNVIYMLGNHKPLKINKVLVKSFLFKQYRSYTSYNIKWYNINYIYYTSNSN